MIENEGMRGVGGEQGGGAIYDEDEEDEGVGGAQRVGCSLNSDTLRNSIFTTLIVFMDWIIM